VYLIKQCEKLKLEYDFMILPKFRELCVAFLKFSKKALPMFFF
jgi:hypothetical protein